MSPTVFRYKNFRFFFFSREEKRIHIHASMDGKESKFWIEPIVSLAHNHNFSSKELKEIHNIVEDRINEIKKAWKKHFPS